MISHNNGSDDGEGSVEIEVSVPAATPHLVKHDGDCVVGASNDELLDAMKALQNDDCIINE